MDKILSTDLYLSSLNASNSKVGNQLGKDEFLKILMTQLSNQDPLNPMQDREFISQMATFSSLEQMVNMNEALSNLQSGQMFANKLQYSELIGKEVTWSEMIENEDGEENVSAKSGKVAAVHYNGNEVKVEVENGEIVDVGLINEIRVIKEQEVNNESES
jgi:flagellar basal-body rod modification protein FlgD